MVVDVLPAQLEEAGREIVPDVRADLPAAIVGKAVVAIAVMMPNEPADRVEGVLVQRPRLIGVEPVEAGIAQRQLRPAARGGGAGDGNVVDDRRRVARIDRRRPAAHHFHPLGHQVVAVHAFAGIEEEAVDFLVQRQAVLLEIEIAAIGRDAAYAGDVLHLAAGRLDLDARDSAEQVGGVERGDLLNIVLRQAVDRIGDVEAALGTGRSGDDDVLGRFVGRRIRRRGGTGGLRRSRRAERCGGAQRGQADRAE